MNDPAELIEGYLREQGVPFKRTDDQTWAVRLSGRTKHELVVLLQLSDARLRAEAFFMRCPQEDHAGVWRLLLRQNLRAPAFFAVDDGGDAYVVAQLPRAALDEEELDRLLGAMLTVADDAFMPAIERGFATYLARDLAWRARQSETDTSV